MAVARNSRGFILIVVIIAALAVVYGVLNMPDQRNGAEKLGDAIHELPKGVDKAARQLEDRTPAEKMGDAVKDIGDDIKGDTN